MGLVAPVQQAGDPHGSLQVTAECIESDQPHLAILEAAQRLGCDLIVMASHGRHGIVALLARQRDSERGHPQPVAGDGVAAPGRALRGDGYRARSILRPISTVAPTEDPPQRQVRQLGGMLRQPEDKDQGRHDDHTATDTDQAAQGPGCDPQQHIEDDGDHGGVCRVKSDDS